MILVCIALTQYRSVTFARQTDGRLCYSASAKQAMLTPCKNGELSKLTVVNKSAYVLIPRLHEKAYMKET